LAALGLSRAQFRAQFRYFKGIEEEFRRRLNASKPF
jgi:hypothetical protein